MIRRTRTRICAIALTAFAAVPWAAIAQGGEPDSGVMFQRLRHLRSAEPSIYAAYLLRSLRAVGEVAAACGWADARIIDATVDGVIAYLDARLTRNDPSPAELRRRGLETSAVEDALAVRGAAPDTTHQPCERAGKLYLDWSIMTETAGQPAPPFPETATLDTLLGDAGDARAARSIFAMGAALIGIAERADACARAPFARVQALEERVVRDADALLRASRVSVPAAAGLARLLGSERERAELREDKAFSCADAQVGADWRLAELAAQGPSNVVASSLALRPMLTRRVEDAAQTGCARQSSAAAPGVAQDNSPAETSPALAATLKRIAASPAFAEVAAMRSSSFAADDCAAVRGRR